MTEPSLPVTRVLPAESVVLVRRTPSLRVITVTCDPPAPGAVTGVKVAKGWAWPAVTNWLPWNCAWVTEPSLDRMVRLPDGSRVVMKLVGGGGGGGRGGGGGGGKGGGSGGT